MTNCTNIYCLRGITTQYCDTHRGLFATFAMMNAHGHFWVDSLEDLDHALHLPDNPIFDYLQEEDRVDDLDIEYRGFLTSTGRI